MKLNRILYLGYYFKKANFQKLTRFRRYVTEKHQLYPTAQWTDMIFSALKYNISFDDYYLFRFYEKDEVERKKWAGTGTMYEYQKIMNPPGRREVLSNKLAFQKIYAPFIRHRIVSIRTLETDPAATSDILKNKSGRIVL